MGYATNIQYADWPVIYISELGFTYIFELPMAEAIGRGGGVINAFKKQGLMSKIWMYTWMTEEKFKY